LLQKRPSAAIYAARRTDERPRRRHAPPLEEGLLNFSAAVVISHDRWFLNRVATHILAFEGNSEVYWHEGNFDSYEAIRHERMGADADQPHRIKYKKLAK
jgi:ATPase subunit of ABC transporter with duplicated ATPase domains